MKSNRIVIVQCRLSSTRLPGKAIKQLGSKPLLGWVLTAMKKIEAKYYYVATDEKSYETILPICKQNGFECFAGSPDDVLKRFCDLLNIVKDAETVIRVTADNPFLFYEAAIDSVEEFEDRNISSDKCDYLTYSGLPHGSGVEIFSSSSIKKAATETSDPYDHEHVGPALYNHKDVYNCKFVKAPAKYNYPEYRTTIDTYSDYLRALAVINYLGCEGPYNTEQIVEAVKSDKVQKPVVLVPSVKKGQGTGHLHRCLDLALKNKCFVYIPDNKTLEECDSLLKLYISQGLNEKFIINRLPDETFRPVYVTDAFKLSKEEYESLSVNQGIISIDEGSDFSKYSNYLLDIIPNYKLSRKPNKTDFNLLEKPVNRKPKDEKKSVKDVLICFGGEDPANLTEPAVKAVSKCFPELKITAVCNRNVEVNNPNVKFVKQIPQLKEKLYKFDVVITHYGLTAFEAAYAGCGVILLPTTKLHKKLAEKYNFDYLANIKFNEKDIRKAFNSEKLYPLPESVDFENRLPEVINKITKGRNFNCPVCGDKSDKYKEPDEVISRNETRTYRRCRKCGLVYMSYTVEPEMKYEKSYFFDDYKKQYGKTYEEDFESIKSQGLRRLNNIKKITRKVSRKTLLDIGCAYGPFLSAASDNEMFTFGTDISEDAISYVKNKLSYDAVCCPFPDINTLKEFGVSQFDVVSMWYVIEHFTNLDIVLKKVNEILKFGGIFAFSTPCGEGVSAKSDLDHFYEISPSDHYSIWEISRAGKVLKKYGFKIEKIVSTGHHPERFPVIKKNNTEKGTLLWNLVNKISHLRKLGDTVEIYCRKIK